MIYFVAKLISSHIIPSQLMNFVIFLCRALCGCSIPFLKKIRWVIPKLHKPTCCLCCCIIQLWRQSFGSSGAGLWAGSALCVPAACTLECAVALWAVSSSTGSWPLGELDPSKLPSLLLSPPQGAFLSFPCCGGICRVCVFAICLF